MTQRRDLKADRKIGFSATVAFYWTESIGIPKLFYAAQWLAYTIPVNASPRSSRNVTHDSGPA